MQETTQTLMEARDRAASDFESLERQIAQARLDGDKKALEKLRAHRDDAIRDADEANDALILAEEQERTEADQTKVKRRREATKEAECVQAERLNAAGRVDKALVELEQAVTRYQALGRELGRLTGSGSAIARKESQNMRWSIWASAERTAELLCVPFANGHRRKTLAELEAGGRPRET
jgi:hypothetical protein